MIKKSCENLWFDWNKKPLECLRNYRIVNILLSLSKLYASCFHNQMSSLNNFLVFFKQFNTANAMLEKMKKDWIRRRFPCTSYWSFKSFCFPKQHLEIYLYILSAVLVSS